MALSFLDIGDEIWRELKAPDSISVASIVYWLRNNIGALNSLIQVDFDFDDTGLELTQELGDEEKVILKKMYNLYYFDKKVRENLSAASFDVFVSVSSDGSTVKKVNKTKIADTYQTLYDQEEKELNDLTVAYYLRLVNPQQVAGDDTISETVTDTGQKASNQNIRIIT